jgi:hypothetical protein
LVSSKGRASGGTEVINVKTASKLLDFGARIGPGQRADEQLDGAVAIHNILENRGVAYLADEVGMGKTYVALGALALFRHYQPDFRVLIIAPRRNIQYKWMKELRNFVAYNVRFPDMRMKALDGRPVKPLIACGNLLEFVHEAALDPNRDFFLRLSSFSLPVTGKDTVDPEGARRLREGLRKNLPWMSDAVFDLRSKQSFKDNVARAVCCALPRFDLVIVDEGHNLKHGFSGSVSARNRVLGLSMGRSSADIDADLFPGYGRRAEKVLFLSATPVEETYRHLWNQLDVFGIASRFDALKKSEADEQTKKESAADFLIRRVTSIRSGGIEHTKNLYRREWRRGGVDVHDEPIRIENPKQRLVVALVQKKISEILGHERFNSSFQIGMLASFESFLETTRTKTVDGDTANFDDLEQTDDELEREGLDVADVNRLSRSYRSRFGSEMPHPKMDGIVATLSHSWRTGTKTLIFVRRVASVKELKQKLDELYDIWLLTRLERELPEAVQPRLARIVADYKAQKLEALSRRSTPEYEEVADSTDETDSGGKDTFFAWFFRGEGPPGVVSGANIQQRFIQRGTTYSTFFLDNYAADLLNCSPKDVGARLRETLGVSEPELREGLRKRARRFLSRARKPPRADQFEAVQAATVEWLKDHEGPHQEKARIVWHEHFEYSIHKDHAPQAPEIADWLLELETFFTLLRARPALRQRLWPDSKSINPVEAFREREIRGHLLASAARLGHALIDLYVLTIRRVGSLQLRAQEKSEDDADLELRRIVDYLDLLESGLNTPLGQRDWQAFDELAEIADNFDLIVDVNDPDARTRALPETARTFGQLLRKQQPTGGMSGQVNETLVRQFRMPGYPFVLVTTDLLQEGEDLHTFCSSVHHYGIAWTPSSMEQRTGRIDRVRSQTERRLIAIEGRPWGEDELLQVYFPHLEDTVEVFQVQRVLQRMNVFLRLMHEGLTTQTGDGGTINVGTELAKGFTVVPQIRERLKSAFPIKPETLRSPPIDIAVTRDFAVELGRRFKRIIQNDLPGLEITWEPPTEALILLGTARLKSRIQPFSLQLRSVGAWPAVRCVSPVGIVGPEDNQDSVVKSTETDPIRVGAIEVESEGTFDLTVEGDILLGRAEESDNARVALLIDRIVHQADMLEKHHLPGQDEQLSTFKSELILEASHGR